VPDLASVTSAYRYRAKAPSLPKRRMMERMRLLSEKHPRYCYRRITALLRQEGWQVGKRQLQRLRRAQGLRVPSTKRKIVRRGLSTGLPTNAIHRGHVWTWDFISDATVRGGTLRILTILDEHTRECHVLRADRALRSKDVLECLGKAIKEHGAPQYLRSDNGSSSLPRKCTGGWRRTRSRPFTSSRPVRDRTGSWRASMAGSGTSA
jgi:putative transposase